MIRILLVVQVPHTRDKGMMAVLLRPIDSFLLSAKSTERMIGVVLDHITFNR